MTSKQISRRILVTGATGYVGGRLVPRLLAAGFHVRCLVRDRRKLGNRSWSEDRRVEIFSADVADFDATSQALEGCFAAYYLVHSMLAAGATYAERDRQLASNFARAAAAAGVQRLVYLGGLGETGGDLSEHLTSRRQVEEVLADGPVPLTVLRAAMIIGSGSASFEILRYLVERLPVMITPRWVQTESQPIAVDNVLHYLVACLQHPETAGQTLDIGGPEVLSYEALMREMATALGLRPRRILRVPVLTPRLSSLWIHLVTPIHHHIARPLAEGLRNRVVCRDDRAVRLMPQRLLTPGEAIRTAIRASLEGSVPTSWTDAGPVPGDPDWAGGTVLEERHEHEVAAPVETCFAALCRLGGDHGWYAAAGLWRLRGLLDRLVGGPGLRRGRRDPEKLAYGDAIDFWRVVDLDPPRRLALLAEMRLPGEARLEFALEPLDSARTRLVQTARFRPRGLAGILYWYAVKPFHGPVFRGMLRGIGRAAEAAAEPTGAPEPLTPPAPGQSASRRS